jgi:hypothetical protein
MSQQGFFIREMVREFLEDHLGCSQKEVAHYTGLSRDQVQYAWSAIARPVHESLHGPLPPGLPCDWQQHCPVRACTEGG